VDSWTPRSCARRIDGRFPLYVVENYHEELIGERTVRVIEVKDSYTTWSYTLKNFILHRIFGERLSKSSPTELP
jgi:hypothetical protein